MELVYVDHIREHLDKAVVKIEKRHSQVMKKKAAEGQPHALEQLWHSTVKERWKIKSFAFSNKEKGNIKVYAQEFEDEAGSIIISAIEHWEEIRRDPSLNIISPMPEFGSFFSFRKRIYGWVKAYEVRKVHQVAKELHTEEQLPSSSIPSEGPGKPKRPSFYQMALESKKRLQEREDNGR